MTGGVTEALADPDAAVWDQEADLSDRDAPPRLIEPAAAISRFLDVLGSHQVSRSGPLRDHPLCMRRSWPPGGRLAQYEQSDAEPPRLPGHSPFRPGAAGGRLRLRRQRIRESSVRRQSFVECRRSVGVRLGDVDLGGVVLRCGRAARITAGTHQHQAER
jgi:hypothetical protein